MSEKLRWEVFLGAALLALAGTLGGWFAAHRGMPPAEDHEEEQGPDEARELSKATLRNLGVRIDEIAPETFYRHVPVAGRIVATPQTERPLHAPIGGRIDRIEVKLGQAVAPGHVLVEMVRDPIPRPALTLTANVLEPAPESLHEDVVALRKSIVELELAERELARVREYTRQIEGSELPILPKQREIDLEYQVVRLETEREHGRHELEKHGLSEEQIRKIEEGGPVPPYDQQIWKRALARNGLWPAAAEALHATLPDDVRALPWVTATIGELAASGLATTGLVEWFQQSPHAASHFLEFGVLLQRGHTLADLKYLHDLGAFEPIIELRAPALDEPDAAWDVAELLVQPGARVEAGTPLVTLRDPRRLYLRAAPVGGEVEAILDAARTDAPLTARPLIQGSGPVLEDLAIHWVSGDRDEEGTIAWIEVRNQVRNTHGGDVLRGRTWSLREGMKYVLRVPTQRIDEAFVLPTGAVTDDGPDQVVFLEDAGTFRPVPVALAYRDHEVAVVPITSDVKLFPGDRIVLEGAFELGLALSQPSGGADHGHHHH